MTSFFAKLDALEFDETFEDYWDATIAQAVADLKELHIQEHEKVEDDEAYELPFIHRAMLCSELAALTAAEGDTGRAVGVEDFREHAGHSELWLRKRLEGDDRLNDDWADRNPNECVKEKRTFNIRWWRGVPKRFVAKLEPRTMVYCEVTENPLRSSRVLGHIRNDDLVQVVQMRFIERDGRWGGIRLCAHVSRLDVQTQEVKLITTGWFSAAAPPDHHHYTAWEGVMLQQKEVVQHSVFGFRRSIQCSNFDAAVLPEQIRLQYFAMQHSFAQRLTVVKKQKRRKKDEEADRRYREVQMWHDECMGCIARDNLLRDAAGGERKQSSSSELALADYRGGVSYYQVAGDCDGIVAVGLESPSSKVLKLKLHNKHARHWLAQPGQAVELHDVAVLSTFDKRKGWEPTELRVLVGNPEATLPLGWLTVSCREILSAHHAKVRLVPISLPEFQQALFLDDLGVVAGPVRSLTVSVSPCL